MLPDLPTVENELGSVANGIDLVDAKNINDLRRFIEALSIIGAGGPTIDVPFYRYTTSGGAGGTSITDSEATNFLVCRQCNDAADQGSILTPRMIPELVDFTQPADIWIYYGMSGSDSSGNTVVWEARIDAVNKGQVMPTITEWTSAVHLAAVLATTSKIYNELIATIPGGTIPTPAAGDQICMNMMVQRLGTHASDTHTGALRLIDTAMIRFKRK